MFKVRKDKSTKHRTRKGRGIYLKPKIFNRFFNEFTFILVLILLIFGIEVFSIGFHNVDLCNNEMGLEKEINKVLDKSNISGKYTIRETRIFDREVHSLKDCYLDGLEGLTRGFYISIFGAFLLGYIKGG